MTGFAATFLTAFFSFSLATFCAGFFTAGFEAFTEALAALTDFGVATGFFVVFAIRCGIKNILLDLYLFLK